MALANQSADSLLLVRWALGRCRSACAAHCTLHTAHRTPPESNAPVPVPYVPCCSPPFTRRRTASTSRSRSTVHHGHPASTQPASSPVVDSGLVLPSCPRSSLRHRLKPPYHPPSPHPAHTPALCPRRRAYPRQHSSIAPSHPPQDRPPRLHLPPGPPGPRPRPVHAYYSYPNHRVSFSTAPPHHLPSPRPADSAPPQPRPPPDLRTPHTAHRRRRPHTPTRQRLSAQHLHPRIPLFSTSRA